MSEPTARVAWGEEGDPHAAHRAAIAARYGFAGWQQTPVPLRPSAKQFLLEHESLPDVSFERRQPVRDSRAYTDHLRAGDPTVLYSVTVVECSTVELAHDMLLGVLLDSMAPDLARIRDVGILAGDVGFTGREEPRSFVAFVRGDVFVQIDSIGSRRAPVGELAEAVDDQILTHLGIEPASR